MSSTKTKNVIYIIKIVFRVILPWSVVLKNTDVLVSTEEVIFNGCVPLDFFRPQTKRIPPLKIVFTVDAETSGKLTHCPIAGNNFNNNNNGRDYEADRC